MKTFRTTLALSILALLSSSCLAVSDPYQSLPFTRTFELGIVLDSSTSVSDDDFLLTKNFLVTFLDYFDIGPRNVRVALVMYAQTVDAQGSIKLSQYTNKKDLLQAVRGLTRLHGTRTETGAAIDYMHDVLMSDAVTRPDVPKVMVVFTDGRSQHWKRTKQSALRAQNDGINMFAVGIGDNVLVEEVNYIADNAKRAFFVDSTSRLDMFSWTLPNEIVRFPLKTSKRKGLLLWRKK